jgi:hypothetical protein
VLWHALLGAGWFDPAWPPEVRAYFATRLVEWEVGNGGFRQAAHNAGDFFDEAIAGYELMGLNESAALIREAKAQRNDDAALDALDERVTTAPWPGVPWADEARLAYVRTHREAFRF